MSLEPAQLTWFAHNDPEKFPAVAIIRDHKGGALVVGGPTGSHYTGHGECWKKKEEIVRNLGYLEVSAAAATGALTPDWQAPAISGGDADLIEKIRAKII